MKIMIMMIRLILPGVMREELVELLLRAHDMMLGGLHIYMTLYDIIQLCVLLRTHDDSDARAYNKYDMTWHNASTDASQRGDCVLWV